MKKKIYIALIFIGGLIALCGLLVIFKAIWFPVFDMVVPLAKYPETVQIYKMGKSDITMEDAKALGAKFGLTGEVSEGEKNYLISNPDFHESLEVYKGTGAIRYHKSVSYPGRRPRLPAYEEAAKIAVNTLRKLDFLPEGEITTSVMSGGSEDLIVSVKYLIDGHPFGGNRYTVRIGEDGVVVYVGTNPVKYEPYKMVKLKPVKLAYQELKTARFKFTRPSTNWVSINDVSITYWLESSTEIQEYVYPVYVFRGYAYESIPVLDRHPNQYGGAINATDEAIINIPGILENLVNSEFVSLDRWKSELLKI